VVSYELPFGIVVTEAMAAAEASYIEEVENDYLPSYSTCCGVSGGRAQLDALLLGLPPLPDIRAGPRNLSAELAWTQAERYSCRGSGSRWPQEIGLHQRRREDIRRRVRRYD